MRVAIDATPIVALRKGVGSMLEGLITESAPTSTIGSAILFIDSTFEAEARRLWPNREIIPVSVASSLLWEVFFLPRAVRRERIDALITVRDRTALPDHVRSIVWLFEIPDHRTKLIARSDSSRFQKVAASASRWRFRQIARRVSHFLVSSQFTRLELIRQYRVAENRVSLAYPGIARMYFSEGEDTIGDALLEIGENPYILHFGTGDPRDNSEFVLECFAELRKTSTMDVRLVIAGVPDPARRWFEISADRLGIRDKLSLVGYVSSGSMPALYRGATVYFDPTLVEGFGIQLVEAMASGVPVVSSNVSAVPELVGDCGLLFDPKDAGAFVRAIRQLLENPEARRVLGEKGRERAASFTWEALLDQFETIVNKSG